MSQVQIIPITKIKVAKDRTREDFGDMEGLVESIKDKGVLQPITVSKDFHLLAGGRRYEASLRAGLKQIPVLIHDSKSGSIDALEIELIENTARKDFTWQEQARHIARLQEYCTSKNIDWSQRKLATMLDRSPKTVSRQLALASAMRDIPELAAINTQDEAEKVIKRMHEEIVVGELRRRQESTKNRGLESALFVAKGNYNIGDCFKGMAELRTNGEVHFIEFDPPYAIDLGEVKKGADAKAKSYNEIPKSKYEDFMQRIGKETFRVANHHAWMICWFGPTHFTMVKDALIKGGWSVNDMPGLWVKPSGQTMAPEYNLANCYEMFFVCRKGRPVLSKRGRSNVFQYSPVPATQKYHPTERPVALIADILETFMVPMTTCLVPCLGSGATLRACYTHGVRGFGYDLSNEYLDKFLLAVEEDTRKLDKEE